MNELTAVVALAQLLRLDGIREHCRKLRDRIMRQIGKLPGLHFRRIPDESGDFGFEIYFCLPTPALAEEFSRKLDAQNINCMKTTGTYCQYDREYCRNRATWHPASSPFAKFAKWPTKGYRHEDFPKTENLIHRFVVLPLGALYTEEDADSIAKNVSEVYHETCH